MTQCKIIADLMTDTQFSYQCLMCSKRHWHGNGGVNHSQLFANCNVEALDAVMIDTHRRRAISKTTDSSAVVRDAFVQIFNSINVLNL